MIPRRPGLVLIPTAAALLLAAVAAAQTAAPAGMPSAAAADTVRTNLWLTEALMAEIVSSAAAALPPPPAAVRLQARGEGQANDLFGATAARVLGGQGYELYIAAEDSVRQAAVDAVFAYDVQGVELSYPEVGRTLGIWRSWIERDVAVSALVEVTDAASGRLLLKERLVRSFGDRVPDDAFGGVDSRLYPFTSAATGESGWQRRVEEFVVLGALAGLVAVYFANTRD
ncbi:MAG: hypothetical protein IH621_00370 [Krumholzibacteria bacterium]|nr:hypothetical protein [Candidatus Krumholzibacteria bacterium]